MQDNTFHSHFHALDDKTIRYCVSKLQENKLVILPSNNTYLCCTNLFNQESIEFLLEVFRCKPSDLVVYTLTFDIIKLFTNLNSSNIELIETIIKEFDTDLIDFNLKLNDNVPIFIKKYNNLKFNISKNDTLSKFIKYANMPIIGIPVKHPQYDIYCVDSEQIQHSFNYIGIDILLGKEPCKNGILPTEIEIDNEITIHRRGLLTIDDLKDKYPNHIINEKDMVEDTIKSNKKKGILFNLMKVDMVIDETNLNYIKNIRKVFEYYLHNSVVIDFGSRNRIFSYNAAGYVDLSETSNIKEAIYNIYNVLYQVNTMEDVSNILIFDYYSYKKESIYKTLSNILDNYCNNLKMVIPLESFSEEEIERWKRVDIDGSLVEYNITNQHPDENGKEVIDEYQNELDSIPEDLLGHIDSYSDDEKNN